MLCDTFTVALESEACFKFMAYDQMHWYLMPTRVDETNTKRFVAGATSGVISVLFTYPLELIRVRLAVETRTMSSAAHPIPRPLLRHAVSQIYHEGTTANATAQLHSQRLFVTLPLFNFYRGFSVTILGMVPYAGTSFLAWGYLRSRFLPLPSSDDPNYRKAKQKLHPVMDLVLGGIAGAVAQTASYPFEVVRRRMQVGGLTRPDSWLGWGETVKSIWKQRGWRGFYVGLGIGFIKVVPMTAVSYAVWEAGKTLLGV